MNALTASSLKPTPRPHGPRHTAVMALRFTVQGDDEQETAAGLEMLLSLGLQKHMPPRQLTDSRWMARAVPRMTKARTEDGPGPSVD